LAACVPRVKIGEPRKKLLRLLKVHSRSFMRSNNACRKTRLRVSC